MPDRIIGLQKKYGTDKVIVLRGNHEDMAIEGSWRNYIKGNTIFCHAGIDEEAEELWEFSTDEHTFTEEE